MELKDMFAYKRQRIAPEIAENMGRDPGMFQYLVTIQNRKTGEKISFEYGLGIAHVYKHLRQWPYSSEAQRDALVYSAYFHEHGYNGYKLKKGVGKFEAGIQTLENVGFDLRAVPIAPSLCDALYALASDAQAAQDYSLDEFLAGFGYDEDSHRGRKAYAECQKTLAKWRQLVRGSDLDDEIKNLEISLEELEIYEKDYEDYDAERCRRKGERSTYFEERSL